MGSNNSKANNNTKPGDIKASKTQSGDIQAISETAIVRFIASLMGHLKPGQLQVFERGSRPVLALHGSGSDSSSEVIYCTVRLDNGGIYHATSGGQFVDPRGNARFRLVSQVSNDAAAASKADAASKGLTQDEKFGRIGNSEEVCLHYDKVVFMVTVLPMCTALQAASPAFAKAFLSHTFVECTAFGGSRWMKATLFDFDKAGSIKFPQAVVVKTDGGHVTLPAIPQVAMKLSPLSTHAEWQTFLAAIRSDLEQGTDVGEASSASSATSTFLASGKGVALKDTDAAAVETALAAAAQGIDAMRDIWTCPCDAVRNHADWKTCLQAAHPFLSNMGQKRAILTLFGKVIEELMPDSSGIICALQGRSHDGSDDSKVACGTEDTCVLVLKEFAALVHEQNTRDFWDDKAKGVSHPLLHLEDADAVKRYEDALVVSVLEILLAYRKAKQKLCNGLFRGMEPPSVEDMVTVLREIVSSSAYPKAKEYVETKLTEADVTVLKDGDSSDMFELFMSNQLHLRFCSH